MPPDSDAPGLYQYVGSQTRPVRFCSKTVLQMPTVGADSIRPWREAPSPPLEGNVINLRFLNFSLNC